VRVEAEVPWYSFDPIASSYDRTRTLHRRAIDAALRVVERRFPPARYSRVLDVGVGTGRLAVPFARHGYRVVGVDLSNRMLEHLRRRRTGLPVNALRAVRADATRLPFADRTFDLAYWVHVLHLIPRWKAAVDETLRVTRPGGVLLNIRTEGGREIEELFDEYHRILAAAGYRRPRVGVRHRETLLRHLERRGCTVRRRTARWEWEERVSVGEALHYLEIRSYSWTRFAPLPVHRRAMNQVRAWAARELGAPDRRYRVVGAVRFDEARTPR
jgi:ubiquinone/menaquinone biosynthesis C-methylase UbiE